MCLKEQLQGFLFGYFLFPLGREEPCCLVRFSSFIELGKPKLSGAKVCYALSQLRESVDCEEC